MQTGYPGQSAVGGGRHPTPGRYRRAEASQELAEAATTLATAPGALQLRTLQPLAEVATEKHSTLIFPIPMEFLAALQNVGNRDR